MEPDDLTLGSLLVEEPRRWGLRGDPFLWRALRDALAETPLPASESNLEREISEAYAALTGRPLSTPGSFFVAEFAHGGMSSGRVSSSSWREEALPLILRRYAKYRDP